MARYVYGLDPASKSDYFGIVVHQLPEGESKVPKLKALNQLNHTSFDRLYDYIVNDMFRRYPPYYIVIDYSNERTFSDLLLKVYGKSKVELVQFTTASKTMLKEDGLSVIQQGYKFPNPSKISDPTAGRYVMELVQQLKQEQIVVTKTGKTSFDHPAGKHNDLAIAWELSVHGCLKFTMRGNRNVGMVYSRKYDAYDEGNYRFGIPASDIPNRTITLGSAVYYPGQKSD
jgi:hypothetical protein